MRDLSSPLRLALLAAALTLAAAAEDEQPAAPAVLMELYTSQGCYSCPPADDLLRTVYGGQPDLLPLELHVDYWDTLIYGFSGSWKDPFSSKEYTNRQTAYNLKLRDTRTVYTPQLIVQGRHQAVGSKQGRIDPLVAEERGRATPLRFYFSGSASEGWRARIDGAMQGNEDLYYAIYHRERVTEVEAGENKGKRMINSNVVTRLQRQRGRGRQISVPSYDAASDGCAVWVQKPQTGEVIAAAKCPESAEHS